MGIDVQVESFVAILILDPVVARYVCPLIAHRDLALGRELREILISGPVGEVHVTGSRLGDLEPFHDPVLDGDGGEQE